MKKRVLIILIPLILIFACKKSEYLSIVTVPDSSYTNFNYLSNRAPLEPSVLIKLPVGSIKPEGWLKEVLIRQSDGLSGHLGEISAWLQKEDNAWLSPTGEGNWGWEEVPYWLKGYANTGYILGDKEIINEAMIWIEGVLGSQREDGNFGPFRARKGYITDEERAKKEAEIEVQDFWANMIMLYCLRSYYEYSGDKRVIDLMTDYFKYQLSVPDEEFLSVLHYWQKIRGGDNLASVIWLYNVTGDEFLLDLAEKVHRNTAKWYKRGNDFEDVEGYKYKREGFAWPEWYGDIIDWHNVNIAQGFREPAQYYQLSHNKSDLQATYDAFNIVREHFGQVPGGMYGADEVARPGYDDPRQAIETCGIVEQMNSDEHLLRITGDIFWADHAEDVAFNTFPAAMMPDLRSLRYLTGPNMAVSDDESHSPGIMNGGPHLVMNPFSSRCCQHNHTQGWPYLIENLWMATPDNGLAAVIYSASKVSATVAEGNEVAIECETTYPFEDELRFKVKTREKVLFPLYFRIPGWCTNASLKINDREIRVIPESGKYIRIERYWSDGDKILLNLPRSIVVKEWELNHNSVSVYYGALSFSLKIVEEYRKQESDKTAQRDSKWQQGVNIDDWPSYEILPLSVWNYGLIFDKENPSLSFSIKENTWPHDNFPFTLESTPIELEVDAKRIPEWKIDEYGLVGELQDSPLWSDEPVEKISLLPMGAARLRISAFPVIADKKDAVRWK